jgi:hypothetical protein
MNVTMTGDTLKLLHAFARALVEDWRQVRAVVLRNPAPEIHAGPGDMVVYAAGQVWPDGRTWLVLQDYRRGKPVYSIDRTPGDRKVCGRILFTIHQEEAHV